MQGRPKQELPMQELPMQELPTQGLPMQEMLKRVLSQQGHLSRRPFA
jgi:hypothetical protein